MVHRLEGHAAGDAAVADDGHRVAVLALQLGGDRHPQGRADRGARMADPERVILALGAVRERAHPVPAADRRHPGLAPGEDFVRVGLVADIPDQPVMGRVEHIMQRHRQLHRAQSRREMPAGHAHRLRQERAQLLRQGLEQLLRQAPDIARQVYFVEQG